MDTVRLINLKRKTLAFQLRNWAHNRIDCWWGRSKVTFRYQVWTQIKNTLSSVFSVIQSFYNSHPPLYHRRACWLRLYDRHCQQNVWTQMSGESIRSTLSTIMKKKEYYLCINCILSTRFTLWYSFGFAFLFFEKCNPVSERECFTYQ